VTLVEVLWIVAGVILAFGGVAVASLGRAALADMKALTAEVARFGELHGALGRVHAETARSRVIVEDLRGR
jgi:hypothetical protein